MRADKIAAKQPVRMMIVGTPGTAKTGSLASLANMGYKIRVIDFDGNSQSLLEYTDADKLANIDIVYLEDEMRNGDRFIETSGVPTAFKRGLDLMDRWKYKEPDGTEIDLGSSRDWGCDTVVVLDSLTSMGEASMKRQMALSNKTPVNMTDAIWGLAMNQQNAFIEKLTSDRAGFHVIVLSHIKLISPPDVRKGEDEITSKIKRENFDLIPSRFYPSALGRQLPMQIGGHFPILIEATNRVLPGDRVERVFRVHPRGELDLKVPSKVSFENAKVEDALARIFKELAPPLASCLIKEEKTK